MTFNITLTYDLQGLIQDLGEGGGWLQTCYYQ